MSNLTPFLVSVLKGLEAAYQRRFDELYDNNPDRHEQDPTFGMDSVLTAAELQQTRIRVAVEEYQKQVEIKESGK